MDNKTLLDFARDVIKFTTPIVYDDDGYIDKDDAETLLNQAKGLAEFLTSYIRN